MTRSRSRHLREIRNRLVARRRSLPGASPGTLTPDPDATPSTIQVIAYGPGAMTESRCRGMTEVEELIGSAPVVWINVNGLGDIDLIRALGERFGLHRLAVEDVVHTHQRPKVETYDDYLFLTTQMFRYDDGIVSEQISMFLAKGIILTFQESAGDCFDPVRERLRARKGRLRDAGADYLLYALLDALIDAYYPITEGYGETVEDIETHVLENPQTSYVSQIHKIKRDLLQFRRTLLPQREAINTLIRDESGLFSEQTRPYLRDCYDHCIQLLDNVETMREINAALVDVYLSSTNSRLNEVMKVLTVIATIFIPLSFVASVYGMNFDTTASPWNMPELEWVYGYPFALLLMTLTAGGLLVYFWRKGWLGDNHAPPRRRSREP